MSQWEKRQHRAGKIPSLDPEICIPVRQVRAGLPRTPPSETKGGTTKKLLGNAPADFKWMKARGPSSCPGMATTVQVAGRRLHRLRAVCVDICPVKNRREDAPSKPSTWSRQIPIRQRERENYALLPRLAGILIDGPGQAQQHQGQPAAASPLFELLGRLAQAAARLPYREGWVDGSSSENRAIVAMRTGLALRSTAPTCRRRPWSLTNKEGVGRAGINSLFEGQLRVRPGLTGSPIDKHGELGAGAGGASGSAPCGENYAKGLLEADQSDESGIPRSARTVRAA